MEKRDLNQSPEQGAAALAIFEFEFCRKEKIVLIEFGDYRLEHGR